MAELAVETVPETEDTQVEKKSRFQSFTINHPRTAKVVGVVAITAVTMGAVAAWQNRKQLLSQTEESEIDEETSSDESSETI